MVHTIAVVAILLVSSSALAKPVDEDLSRLNRRPGSKRRHAKRSFDESWVPNLSLHVLKLPGLELVKRVELPFDANIHFRRIGSSLVFEAQLEDADERGPRGFFVLGRDHRLRPISAKDPRLARARRSPPIPKPTLEGKARRILADCCSDPDPKRTTKGKGTAKKPCAKTVASDPPRLYPISAAGVSLDGKRLYYSSSGPGVKQLHFCDVVALDLATGEVLAKTRLADVGHKWGDEERVMVGVRAIFATADEKLVLLAGSKVGYSIHDEDDDFAGISSPKPKRKNR